MDEEPTKMRLAVLRRTWWPTALLVVGVQIVAVAALVTKSVPLGLLGVLFLFLIERTRNKVPFAGDPEIPAQIDATGVWSRDTQIVPRARIVAGWVRPYDRSGVVVELRRPGLEPPVLLRVHSIDDGRTLLRALGLDPRRALVRFRVRAPRTIGLRFGVGFLAVSLVASAVFTLVHMPVEIVGLAFVVGLAGLFLAFFAMLFRRLVPVPVTIGKDGLLFGRRVVALHDLVRYEVRAPSVILFLADGREVPLEAPNEEVRAAIVERLDALVEGGRKESGEGDVFVRAGRSAAAFVESMRALAGRREDFRQEAIAPDRMWRVVEDPFAAEDARVGAAIALATDRRQRQKLRVVAEAIVSPAAKRAIEAACEDEDEALRAALEALEEEEGRG